MSEGNRKVSARLGAAIFFFPCIFAWFTLREGYSTTARVVAFVYAGFNFLIGLLMLIGIGSAASTVNQAALQAAANAPPATVIESRNTTPSEPAPTIGTSTLEAVPSPSTGSAKQIAQVAAPQLSADYEANEVAAQMKWGAYRLQVTGVVDKVTLDFEDKPVIEFQGSTIMNGANASLAAGYESRAASVQKGAQVTVVCESVSEVMGSPVLRNCTI